MKKILYILGLVFIGVLIIWFSFSNKSKDSSFSQNKIQTEERVYVAVEGTGQIAIIDAKTQEKIKSIDLSEEFAGKKVEYMPHNVQVSPDNKSVWVTANTMENMGKMSFSIVQKAYADEGHGEAKADWDDQVIVIDPLTDTITRRIDLGKGLHLAHVSITPDSKYAIVAAQEKGMLYKINTRSFEIESSVKTKKNGGPHGLRVSVDGKSAYIAMLDGKSMGILNIENMKLADVALKGPVVQTGVTPDGKYVLASVYDPKSLAVYDIATEKMSYVDLPGEAKGPVQLYPTPDSRFVYVADQGYYFDQPNGDTVYKIDLVEMKVVEAIKVGNAPHGLIVSKDGAFVYVTNLLSDDVSVIDTTTGKEIKRIKIGKNPNGVSMWYGNNIPTSEDKIGALTAVENSFDFGVVSMAKGKVQHSFKIKNSTDRPVEITKIYTSCMCTEATLVNTNFSKGPFGMPGHEGLSSSLYETIKPGQEATIEVEVDPAAHGPEGIGKARKIVYIETNSAVSPKLELVLDIDVVQ